MNTGENKCIRYLMKEMDPSEEVEFEQMMQEDENLLIEVESLKATQKKVDKLPLKTPPESLTKEIAYEANKIQLERVKKPYILNKIFKNGLAAAVLVGALSGGYLYLSDFSEPSEPQPASSEISPWVDRNEILRYTNASHTSNASALDEEVNKSYEKLQLVRFPAGERSASGIHLTGAPK